MKLTQQNQVPLHTLNTTWQTWTPILLRTWTPTSLSASNLCMPSTPSNFLHTKILLPSTSACSKHSHNYSAVPDNPPLATFNAVSSVTPRFYIITLTSFSAISMHWTLFPPPPPQRFYMQHSLTSACSMQWIISPQQFISIQNCVVIFLEMLFNIKLLFLFFFGGGGGGGGGRPSVSV